MFLDGFWTGNKRRKERGFPGFLSRRIAVAVYSLSRVQFSTTQRTQTVACPLLCPRDHLGKNTGVGCHFLLQGIFPTQRLNPCLMHWQADSFLMRHQGSLLWQLLTNKLHCKSTKWFFLIILIITLDTFSVFSNIIDCILFLF